MNAPVSGIAVTYQRVRERLIEEYPGIDDDPDLLRDVLDGATTAQDVVAGLVRQAMEAAAMRAAVHQLAEDYANRAARLSDRYHRLKHAALRLMEDMGETTIRRPEFTLSVSHRKGTPEVYDEEALPQSLFKYKTVRSVDREKLAEAVAAGDVPGVRVGNGSSVLSVRMK